MPAPPLPVALIALLLTSSIRGDDSAPAPSPGDVVDTLIEFDADDGTPLVAKLSVPAGHAAPVPVVFYLHGAGARNYDNPFPYRDEETGEIRSANYLDFFSRELARRGIAFFRMSKRGCLTEGDPPTMRVEREVFSGATPSVLLADYGRGIAALRERPEVDPQRIVLLSSSEGTMLAPQLAKAMPDGIVAVLMHGYAADNARDTITWQTTVGPWRNIEHLIPAARDGALTQQEHADWAAGNPTMAPAIPFGAMDVDGDGALTAADLAAVNAPYLEAILDAVEQGDDDLLWDYLLNLSSAYLREWWDAEPTHVSLAEVDVPLVIYHGGLDGTCRVEGVHEAAAALAELGRDNLTVNVYPEADHDLDWTRESAASGGSPPYRDTFDDIAVLVRTSADG